MPVYKDEKTNTWRVIYRYKNALGQRKQGQRKRIFESLPFCRTFLIRNRIIT